MATDSKALTTLAAFGAGAALSAIVIKKLNEYQPPSVWKVILLPATEIDVLWISPSLTRSLKQSKPALGAFAHINKPTAGAQKESTLPKGEHPIQLYSLGTPNGVKGK